MYHPFAAISFSRGHKEQETGSLSNQNERHFRGAKLILGVHVGLRGEKNGQRTALRIRKSIRMRNTSDMRCLPSVHAANPKSNVSQHFSDDKFTQSTWCESENQCGFVSLCTWKDLPNIREANPKISVDSFHFRHEKFAQYSWDESENPCGFVAMLKTRLEEWRMMKSPAVRWANPKIEVDSRQVWKLQRTICKTERVKNSWCCKKTFKKQRGIAKQTMWKIADIVFKTVKKTARTPTTRSKKLENPPP